jgi:hypothetical protein
MLLEILFVEILYLIKRYFFQVIVQIYVICILDNKQFFVITLELFKSIFTKITAVSFLSVNYKNRSSDFISILQDRHID